ncbi:acyl-CoA dehydrogenase family protein [Psychromicrobium lacuslunae]|uniref:acyl-CoA dehydrogenase family protein n=1 Tax=Psychromicrobium lacuslunae TaxID=1618207 RepID=UPI0005D46035|nr:acyl-CoA dehydrogenase family protein [Psychromicrobium lacuslunae]
MSAAEIRDSPRSSEELTALLLRTRALVNEVVLPMEDAFGGDIEAAGGDQARRSLQAAAREAGVFAPHAPVEFGGLGLDMRSRSKIFQASGYSLFGPLAMNIQAPDEGNVHLLDRLASDAQREQYLAPLASGQVRSSFAMTEPHPGAGADPRALSTRAERVPGGWRINGSKTFITGATGAAFFIIMARTAGAPGDAGGATMFLSPADAVGITVGRHLPTIDNSMLGGHCEVKFENLFIPDEQVLGEVDAGMAGIQVRLGPARVTHAMRWLGAVLRAHDVAVASVAERRLFGQRLGDLGLAQQLIADNELDIAASQGLIEQACQDLDAGLDAGISTASAKVWVSEAVGRIADRAMQLCGGRGMSQDLPLARIWTEVRAFRIYDGPSETHRWSVAKRVLRANLNGSTPSERFLGPAQ